MSVIRDVNGRYWKTCEDPACPAFEHPEDLHSHEVDAPEWWLNPDVGSPLFERKVVDFGTDPTREHLAAPTPFDHDIAEYCEAIDAFTNAVAHDKGLPVDLLMGCVGDPESADAKRWYEHIAAEQRETAERVRREVLDIRARPPDVFATMLPPLPVKFYAIPPDDVPLMCRVGYGIATMPLPSSHLLEYGDVSVDMAASPDQTVITTAAIGPDTKFFGARDRRYWNPQKFPDPEPRGPGKCPSPDCDELEDSNSPTGQCLACIDRAYEDADDWPPELCSTCDGARSCPLCRPEPEPENIE